MGDDHMNENGLDSVEDSIENSVEEPETASAEAASANLLVYRLLPTDEWPRALPFLSYCSPGGTVSLDPDSQSIIVAEDHDGNIIGAAIVSGVFHVAYLLPLAKEVNILTMQREVEALLPVGILYYVMTRNGKNVESGVNPVLGADLGMVRCDGTIYVAKVKHE
jgi:hypothetical protein